MTSSMRISLLMGLSLAALAIAPALACGDKIAALGSGVPFARVMAHHSAGRVVVFMNSAAAGNAGDDVQNRLVRELERAGHHVSVVHSETELMSALQLSPIDVVLADISASAPPARAALAATCVIRPANRQPGHLVHVVDDIIARRNSAGDYSCAASGRQGI